MTPLDFDLDTPANDGLLTPLFGRVRLRTLILLRWLAVTGQTLTVLLVHYGLGFDLPLGACLGVIAASAWLNAWLALAQPTQRFAKDWEAFGQLTYDMLQLTALLALTGGMTNPFSVMLVAPVVIAVAALPLQYWIALASIAALGSLAMARFHLPLPWGDGQALVFPLPYVVGMWIALVIAIAFTAIYAWLVGREAQRMGTALAATQNVLAREQRLAALGALSAAAAHELGTPLATIQLTAKEMAIMAKDEEMKEDAQLLVSQAQRCRDILKRLSESHETTDKMHARLGLREAMEEAAAPLRGLGPHIALMIEPNHNEPDHPMLKRKVELIYAMGNFIENAVDFAKTQVSVIARWDQDSIAFTIKDDGPGFPPDILAKIGEPYVTTRRHEPGYGGMGLGVFIAITLAERLHGKVYFDNARDTGGAEITIRLPRKELEADPYYDAAIGPQPATDLPPLYEDAAQ
ncbi:ActS/PrrB/RegB family redox-sensitive histidine kinase [Woodsholea maritima]|uniref:ActS/PrrB/RegB family redox-sensitive histidine kinase n=1 Tax=Woodsholea maritima TaxID=240237 RepID=UPI00036F3C74|nr:ActS/PrrB/RegB family redox-sensitive histidine kinase [Woodsholea maritima]